MNGFDRAANKDHILRALDIIARKGTAKSRRTVDRL